MISLKRQTSKILIAAMIVIVLLGMVQLAFSVTSYSREQTESRLAALREWTDEIAEGIAAVSDSAGAVYGLGSFEQLGASRTKAEEYDAVYDLLGALQIRRRAEQNLDGLFVFYNNFEEIIHALSQKVGVEDKEQLIVAMRSQLAYADQSSVSTVEEAGEHVWYLMLIRRTFAAVAGVCRLDAGMPSGLAGDASAGLIYNGAYYNMAGEYTELSEGAITALSGVVSRSGGSVVYRADADLAGLSAVMIVPESLWLHVSPAHILAFVLLAALLVILFRIFRIAYHQIADPLEDMTRALGEIREGTFRAQFRVPNRVEEIEHVRDTVQVMLGEIEQYKIRSYEDRLEKQKTQLQYLQLQLAPHFYTNCLKNAYYMLVLGEVDNAQEFLLCLSAHFRYLLKSNSELVTVAEECEFVRNYISLQRMMVSVPIVLKLNAEPETENLRVPVLAIQTFVENSVKYGRDPDSETPLEIRVYVKRHHTDDGDFIDIVEEDNGKGYPEDVLRQLNGRQQDADPAGSAPDSEPSGTFGSTTGSTTGSAPGSTGIGIRNLLMRAELQFGERASWYFTNEAGSFSELILPAEEST